jgi:hypothetical protein
MRSIFLAISFSTIVFATPSWMFTLEHENYEVVGYGMAKSVNEAKQNAVTDIAQSIQVRIDSSIKISENEKNGEIYKNTSVDSSMQTKVVLSGVKYRKIEKENGLWYVAAEYDNSPIELKFKRVCPKILKDEKQNRYLKNTALIKQLNTEIKFTLNYKLIRKDSLWQLKYKEILLPLNQENFYKLFSSQSMEKISIRANKKIYSQNDEMYFSIKQKVSGFVSIVYVEHNGKVGVLLANKKSESGFTFPETKSEENFKIVNPYGKTIRELYVVLYSEKEIDLTGFEIITQNLLDESNYNFDELIILMKKYNFSSYKIKINNR